MTDKPQLQESESTDLLLTWRERFWRWQALRREHRRKRRMVRDGGS